MYKLSLLLAVLVLFLVSCNNNTYDFEMNLEKGESYTLNYVTSTNITQEFNGQKQENKEKMQMAVSYNVVDKSEELYNIDMLINNINNLSNSNKEVDEIIKLISGYPISMSVDKKGTVKSVKGFENIVEGMRKYIDENMEIDEDIKDVFVEELSGMFQSDFFKSMFEQSFSFYPEKPVKIGESWVVSSERKVNRVPMNIEMKNTLKSVKDNIATIVGEGTIVTPEEGFTLTMMDIEIVMSLNGTQTYEMKVDMNTGFPIGGEIVQDMSGTSSIMGMSIPQSTHIETSFTK